MERALKPGIRVLMLIIISLPFSLSCQTTSVTEAEVINLIGLLNASSSQNRMARKMLVNLGKDAVPLLVKEIDLPTHQLQMERSSLRAMRALRVLREIKAPQGLPACRRILLKTYLRPTTKHDTALLNETLMYVYDMFDRKEARDIYVGLLTGDPRRYLREIRQPTHWAPMGIAQRVEVNVARGIHLLVKHADKRAKDSLTIFMQRCPAGSMTKTYFHQLAENGYTLTEQAFGEHTSDVPDLLKK